MKKIERIPFIVIGPICSPIKGRPVPDSEIEGVCKALDRAGIHYELVGNGYLKVIEGINTKVRDIDLKVREKDFGAAIEALRELGYRRTPQSTLVLMDRQGNTYLLPRVIPGQLMTRHGYIVDISAPGYSFYSGASIYEQTPNRGYVETGPLIERVVPPPPFPPFIAAITHKVLFGREKDVNTLIKIENASKGRVSESLKSPEVMEWLLQHPWQIRLSTESLAREAQRAGLEELAQAATRIRSLAQNKIKELKAKYFDVRSYHITTTPRIYDPSVRIGLNPLHKKYLKRIA